MMIKTDSWVLRIGLLAILLAVVTTGSAKGFAEKFRDFVLGTNLVSKQEDLRVQLLKTSQSFQCMHCHDGTAASPIKLKHANSSMRFSGHRSVDHPVGMKYANYANNSPVEYVPPENLDRRIILEDGEVTCVSCHETKDDEETSRSDYPADNIPFYSDNRNSDCTATKRLTTGTSSTALCLSCHAM